MGIIVSNIAPTSASGGAFAQGSGPEEVIASFPPFLIEGGNTPNLEDFLRVMRDNPNHVPLNTAWLCDERLFDGKATWCSGVTGGGSTP